MKKLLFVAAFAAGLAVVGWVGSGYLASHPLALATTLLITGFYLLGALELLRFSHATTALAAALHRLASPPERLADWLALLPDALRNAVRQRIEGARAALPGPVLAPYLSGLLVLLGMLGTFAGMAVALSGTGVALEGAQGLAAIRDALSAPVRGLGLAFGTSVAGVAASAALGLMTALARRERIEAGQRLDTAMATALRPFSSQQQRETQLRLMEQQAQLLPLVAERIQACMNALERQQQGLGERLAAEQSRFYRSTEQAFEGLALSVRQTLSASVAETAERAGAALAPAVQTTLAGLAQQSTRLQDAMAEQLRQQLNGLAAQWGQATAATATHWRDALAAHEQANGAHSQALGQALSQFTDGFAQRATALAEQLAAQAAQQSGAQSARWEAVLAQHQQQAERLAAQQQRAQQTSAENLAGHAAALHASVGQAHETLQTRWVAHDASRLAAWTQALQAQAEALRAQWQDGGARTQEQLQQMQATLARAAHDIHTQGSAQTQHLLDGLAQRAAQDEQRLSAWADALQAQALAQQTRGQEHSVQARVQLQQLQDALAHTVQRLEAQGAAQALQWQETLAQRSAADEQRLAAWVDALQDQAAQQQQAWQQMTEQATAQQQQVSAALADAAGEITRQLHIQAQGTLGEVAALLQAAGEAPRAAAEAMGELRTKLADSQVRDDAMLQERGRILEALNEQLESARAAASEQRSVIDTLVQASASLLEQVHARLEGTLQAQADRLEGVALQVTGSAVEVASLGEAFGGAVQLFGDANAQTLAQLQRTEAALVQSLARSDEQLDYYVAQAREVIELSVGAQKQIIDALQQLADQRDEATA